MALTWAQVLGWRLQRQLLDPVGTGSVADVVTRMGAMPAWPDAAAELGIAVRRHDGRSGDAAQALAAGTVVKVFAFRGALHLMTPQDAGAYLVVRASSRMWELASWRRFYELEADDWPAFRDYVRQALDDGPLTHTELVAALRRSSRYRHVAGILADGNDTILKPLTWQGVMGLGPARDGEATFLLLDELPGWAGVPEPDEAGPTVIAAYLHTHGPASPDRIHDWVGKGLGAKRKDVARWLQDVEKHCEHVDVEGDDLLVLRDDLDALHAATPSTAVRLLPSRDHWVMAPGSSDTRVVPAAHKDVVSRLANLVVAGGVVLGTWTVRAERLEVTWFEESGPAPADALGRETDRLSQILDRTLEPVVA